MALANLSIVINTNAEQALASMAKFGNASRDSVQLSARAVDEYADRVQGASQRTAAAAQQLNANMTAANDAIVRKSADAEAAINKVGEAVNNVDTRSFAERFGAAFGTAFGAGYATAQTWLQKTEEYVKEKTKVIAIGLAIGLVSATAAAVYTAYKVITGAVGFIAGLFTGESYKSSNIDALIETNKQVMELQERLAISAVEANALADVMDRLGVDKSGYVETYTKAAAAMRTNTTELDRLGVKYKDTNGQLLTQAEFLKNVKTKLDEYKEGYDRTAAANAIGVGSYAAVSNALKINDGQLQKSKERLDEYNLGIGPESQAAVAKYEQAMRDFESESKKTGEGFKRAIADNIMPALTNLAEFFKDGFPYAVRVFRYSFATVTSLFFGLQTSVYVVAESVLGSIEAMGLGVVGLGTAFARVLTGDIGGAQQALVQGWENAKTRFAQIGTNIVEQAKSNRDAMALAWALDDRNEGIGSARKKAADRNKGLKAWEPAAKPEAPDAAQAKPFDRYMEELDRMVTKTEQSEYAMLRLKAAQEAAKQPGLDVIDAMRRADDVIQRIQRAESQRAVNLYTDKLAEENRQYAEQTDLLMLDARAQEVAAAAIKRRHDAEQLMIAARNSGKPLDDQARADLQRNTDAQIAAEARLIQSRQEAQRNWSFGASKAMQQYVDDAGNAAKQAQSLFSNAFKGIEDALVKFVQTGKLDFKSLADSIVADLARIYVQRQITLPLANWLIGGSSNGGTGDAETDRMTGLSGSGSGFVDGVASLFGLSKNAVGMPYVPRDMLTMVHEGESISPRGANGGGALQVTVYNNAGANVRAQQNASGGLDVIVDQMDAAFADRIASGTGSTYAAMSSRFGLTPAIG